MFRPKEWLQERFGDDIEDIKFIYGELRKWMRGELKQVKKSDVPVPPEEEEEWISKQEIAETKTWYYQETADIVLTIDLYFIHCALKKVNAEGEITDFLMGNVDLLKELGRISLTYGMEGKMNNMAKQEMIGRAVKRYQLLKNRKKAEVLPLRKKEGA